jgi:hypothetical protein
MLVKRLRELLRDERGTTMAELLVGMGAGLTVMFGLTTIVMVTFSATTRVSARVDATQQARIAMTRTIDQLHSACIAPKVPPIRSASSGTELRFVHATGGAVVPTPTLSVISFNAAAQTLTQSDYAWKEGAAPFWVFQTIPSRTVRMAENIRQIGTKPIFSYYGYASGAVSATPLVTPLSELDASRAIQVSATFMTAPRRGKKTEEAAPARIQGSATLRLTASSYNPAAPSLPCQ